MISWMKLRYLALVCGCLLSLAVVCHPAAARTDWLQTLETDAVTWMAQASSPGMAIVIVKNDVAIYAKGFGYREKDKPALVDTDTIFLLGSTTKAFCAAQLAVLADQGKLDWHESVSRRLPLFQMYDPWVNEQFQVEDLLCHRSGLPKAALSMLEALNYPTDARVRGIRFVQPVTSFRTTYAYQNCMYIAAAKLVEAVAGQSWEENLSASIFKPLGMNRSIASQAAVDQMDNVAIGHLILADGSLWPIPPDWFWNIIADRSMGASAVRSSARDMGQWLRLNLSLGKLGTQQIITEANMRYLQAPKILISPWDHGQDSPYWGPVSYCSGWQHYGLSPQPFLYHGGSAIGSGSAVGLAPGAGIGIAVLTNILNGEDLASKIVWRFYDLYFNNGVAGAQLEQNVLKVRNMSRPAPLSVLSPSAAQAPGLPLERYCGAYFNPAYGSFIVSLSGGNLEITMGPNQFRAKLVSLGGNDFSAYLPGYPDKFEVILPITFAFPSTGPAILTTGSILSGPKEVFTRTNPLAPLGLLLLN